MNETSLKKLRGHVIRNASDKRYPNTCPALNSTEKHIEIYRLVSEYVALDEDLAKIQTPSAKRLVEKRMDEIKYELTKFWILTDSQMINPNC